MIFEGTKKSIFFGLGLTRAGKNSPSIDCLVTLACILECTLDYLILGDDFINKVYGMYISDDKVDLVKRVVAELIK